MSKKRWRKPSIFILAMSKTAAGTMPGGTEGMMGGVMDSLNADSDSTVSDGTTESGPPPGGDSADSGVFDIHDAGGDTMTYSS